MPLQITGSRYGRVLFDPPVDLLARVLQHVEQSQRLRCCALVSTKWRHAANLATRSASVTADTQQRFDSLSAWLNSDRNACSKLQCIQVAYKSAADGFDRHRPVLNVPFAALQQLRSLQLLQCRVKAVSPATSDNTNPAGTATTGEAASAAPSAVQEPQCLRALTALSRLELAESSMQLSGLGSCTGLQHLKLCNCGGDDLLFCLQSALPQLQQLTHLDIWMKGNKPHERQKELMSGIFAALSSMQQIKVLHLSASYKRFKAADMTHVPTCLSALHLVDAPALDPSTMSQLQEMTQLQCLHLVRPRQFNPAILSGLTQLTSLSVTECHIEDAGTVNGLLRAVQQMQQLKHLDLNHSLLEDSSEPELYAAFTGSSQLISLDISKNRILPDAYKYMFPADASLTAMTSLATCSDMLDNDRVCERLVACCPALKQLIVMDDVGSASNYPKVSVPCLIPRDPKLAPCCSFFDMPFVLFLLMLLHLSEATWR